MRSIDIVKASVRNSFRSRLRTTLTVTAIFIGAFTLTITNGLGTGINNYIDVQLGSLGAPDFMSVTKAVDTTEVEAGPTLYDPDAAEAMAGNGPPGMVVLAMDDDDLATMRAVDHVVSVEAAVRIAPDYIVFSGGDKYQLAVGDAGDGIAVDLIVGDEFDVSAPEPAIVLPTDYITPLGYDSNMDALGSTVTIGITDANGKTHTLDAEVAGVMEPPLFGSTATPNNELTAQLFELASIGMPVSNDNFAGANLRFDSSLTTAQITALKEDLKAAGYDAITVADQLGAFTSVIDGIILVLNAFAVIALIAAGFGIINTLLMSVQERTREIGLMKAMGMSGGRIFALFSLEAVFIGFLGSAIGAAVGMAVGSIVSSVLAGGLLADLAGLTIVAFTPLSILSVLLLVMGIAFVAAVLPASRAARQSPIDSLRYE